MWRLLAINKRTVYTKADYTFEKLKDFEKVVPYLYPKIEGSWRISLIKFQLDELEHIQENINIPDYVNIYAYLSKDILEKFVEKFPDVREREKTPKEKYNEFLKDFPKMFTGKALKELYSRFHGNVAKIEEIAADLLELTQDKDVIDVSDINKIAVKEDIVYAKDVLYTFLIYDCELIPRRGHKLAGYRWKKPWELYNKLVNNLGRSYSYYAIRKQVDNLVKEKIKYMHNEEYKEEIVEYLDVYQLADLYQSFHLYTSDALFVIMDEIERRKRNDSLFKRLSTTNSIECYEAYKG